MNDAPIRLLDPAVASAPIQCSGVWKHYRFAAHKPRKLKDAVVELSKSVVDSAMSVLRRDREEAWQTDSTRWAIRDFNLVVRAGEIVGIVGGNGAGKSTLLKLLSRILVPTRGTVHVRGRLSAMIELGAGFHEDLTGEENVHLAGSLMGLSRREIQGLYGSIVEFAGLEGHMDTPLKYYSSGMQARLGFSVATAVNPDVLLIDEVLAVGDVMFQNRCMDTIRSFQERGKAILFVSHDMATVRALCQRVLWLKDGVTMAQGDPNQTVDAYLEHYWPGCTQQAQA